jgi:protein-L-isoaspartate(D-aspartate) O-methyltransferase
MERVMEEEHYNKERMRMVQEQIAWRGVGDHRVLAALRSVPRHRFVPIQHRAYAYTDGPLPIGEGQTISQPYIVALMSQLLQLKGDETVLEIGTGSGYQAAVLSCLARQVHTIERIPSLAEEARMVLEENGFLNVQVHAGDGSNGLPEYAPFGGILVAASAPHVPEPLLEQLDEGGRLVLPVGGRGNQILQTWQRLGNNLEHQDNIPVAFVPLRGEHGWKE